MHPFFRVLFYGSPFLTLMALTEGRFALAWSKIGVACLKIATGVVYILLTVSWSIVGTVWLSKWLPSELLVWPLAILFALAFLGALKIGEAVAHHGTKQRIQFLNDVAESAALQ